MESNKIYCGDALEILKTFPSEFVDSCVTSPPYWKCRDYGIDGQIGQEDTLTEYINILTRVFQEVKRVLKREGSLWIVIGEVIKNGRFQLVPERLAFSLVESGFCVRNKIIWHKPAVIPERVKNRFTIDFETIWFLAKIPSGYYFKQLFEPSTDTRKRKLMKLPSPETKSAFYYKKYGLLTCNPNYNFDRKERNRRCVWTISNDYPKYSHYAAFPKKLARLMVEASCPEGGLVLDPFIGIGTTAIVAQEMGRNYIGIDLNPEYCKIAEERLENERKETHGR